MNAPTNTPTLLKKKDLAKRLSVSPRTIDEWVRKRKIPYFQISPRFYLYDFEEVLATLRKQYQVGVRS
jgi:predicted site-specific integrase-resolvase